MERRQAMSEESERIRIRVIGQDDRELVFKVRPDAKLVHLLQNYCEKKQLDFHAMRFYFIDKPIHRKHTAAMLGMRDNNTINAMVEVDGGGGNIPYRRS